MKLYDLPPQWESRKYWPRLGKGAKQEGKFWEEWKDADLLRSRAAGDPLIFSMYDTIVTDAAFNPVKCKKTDRFATPYAMRYATTTSASTAAGMQPSWWTTEKAAPG